MQTTRHLVTLVSEFTSGMEGCHNRFQRGKAGLLVHVDRNPAAIVDDRYGSVPVNRYIDSGCEPGHRFIAAVVDDFAHKVEHAFRTGRTDVHARSLADGLKALHHGDIVGVVFRGAGSFLRTTVFSRYHAWSLPWGVICGFSPD